MSGEEKKLVTVSLKADRKLPKFLRKYPVKRVPRPPTVAPVWQRPVVRPRIGHPLRLDFASGFSMSITTMRNIFGDRGVWKRKNSQPYTPVHVTNDIRNVNGHPHEIDALENWIFECPMSHYIFQVMFHPESKSRQVQYTGFHAKFGRKSIPEGTNILPFIGTLTDQKGKLAAEDYAYYHGRYHYVPFVDGGRKVVEPGGFLVNEPNKPEDSNVAIIPHFVYASQQNKEYKVPTWISLKEIHRGDIVQGPYVSRNYEGRADDKLYALPDVFARNLIDSVPDASKRSLPTIVAQFRKYDKPDLRGTHVCGICPQPVEVSLKKWNAHIKTHWDRDDVLPSVKADRSHPRVPGPPAAVRIDIDLTEEPPEPSEAGEDVPDPNVVPVYNVPLQNSQDIGEVEETHVREKYVEARGDGCSVEFVSYGSRSELQANMAETSSVIIRDELDRPDSDRVVTYRNTAKKPAPVDQFLQFEHVVEITNLFLFEKKTFDPDATPVGKLRMVFSEALEALDAAMVEAGETENQSVTIALEDLWDPRPGTPSKEWIFLELVHSLLICILEYWDRPGAIIRRVVLADYDDASPPPAVESADPPKTLGELRQIIVKGRVYSIINKNEKAIQIGWEKYRDYMKLGTDLVKSPDVTKVVVRKPDRIAERGFVQLADVGVPKLLRKDNVLRCSYFIHSTWFNDVPDSYVPPQSPGADPKSPVARVLSGGENVSGYHATVGFAFAERYVPAVHGHLVYAYQRLYQGVRDALSLCFDDFKKKPQAAARAGLHPTSAVLDITSMWDGNSGRMQAYAMYAAQAVRDFFAELPRLSPESHWVVVLAVEDNGSPIGLPHKDDEPFALPLDDLQYISNPMSIKRFVWHALSSEVYQLRRELVEKRGPRVIPVRNASFSADRDRIKQMKQTPKGRYVFDIPAEEDEKRPAPSKPVAIVNCSVCTQEGQFLSCVRCGVTLCGKDACRAINPDIALGRCDVCDRPVCRDCVRCSDHHAKNPHMSAPIQLAQDPDDPWVQMVAVDDSDEANTGLRARVEVKQDEDNGRPRQRRRTDAPVQQMQQQQLAPAAAAPSSSSVDPPSATFYMTTGGDLDECCHDLEADKDMRAAEVRELWPSEDSDDEALPDILEDLELFDDDDDAPLPQ